MPASVQRVEAAGSEGKEALWPEQEQWREAPPVGREMRRTLENEFLGLVKLVEDSSGSHPYEAFEQELIPALWRVGRLLIGLFLGTCQAALQVGMTTE